MSKFNMILALALIFVMLPIGVSAGSAMSVSGYTADGRITSTVELMSNQYDTFHNVYGVSQEMRGNGEIALVNTVNTGLTGVTSTYGASVISGNLYGSETNVLISVTKPQDVNLCNGCGDTEDCECTPAVSLNIATGSRFNLDSGFVQSTTQVYGPTVTNVVVGAGSGSIGMNSRWVDMNGGCPDVNSEIGSTDFMISGNLLEFTGVYTYR